MSDVVQHFKSVGLLQAADICLTENLSGGELLSLSEEDISGMHLEQKEQNNMLKEILILQGSSTSRHHLVWYGMGWDGMGWYGTGWDGMGWDGLIFFSFLFFSFSHLNLTYSNF